MRLIGQGRTADIYEYSPGEIMKLYHADFPEAVVRHEFRISEMVGSKGLHIPEARLLHKEGNRLGIVFERIEGQTLLALLLGQILSAEETGRMMAECHYGLHMQKDEERALPGQKHILEQAMMRVPMLGESEKQNVLAYLRALPEHNQICHGDFHPDNVMLERVGGRCRVIDWMTGMSGDPAGDVARTWVILKSASLPEQAAAELHQTFETARSLLLDGYIEHYLHLSGMTWEQLEAWILPVAAARLDENLPEGEARHVLCFVRERLASH